MKTRALITIASIILMVSCGMAQPSKGSWAIGVHNFSYNGAGFDASAPASFLGFGFGVLKADYGDFLGTQKLRYSVMGIGLNLHRFVADRVSLGSGLNLFFQNTRESGEESGMNIYSILFSPEVRYYIPLNDKANVYLAGRGGMGISGAFSDGSSSDGTYTHGGAFVGIAMFITENSSLDLGLGGQFYNTENNITNSSVVLDVGFTIFMNQKNE